MLGNGNQAFEYYTKIALAYAEEISDIYKMEPYVYSQMIAGKDARYYGEAKNSWLTGTAVWNFVIISQWILGIKPDYNGLVIDPCIPSEWEGYKVVRWFRDATYEIVVKNPEHICKGVRKVLVDGENIAGNVVPVFSDKSIHKVEVILGSR